MKKAILIIGVSMISVTGHARYFAPDGKKSKDHKVEVTEVIQTTSYTYLHVKENDTLKWLAVPSMQAKAGETYYYIDGLPMEKFESKELHKTFDVVLFLGGVSKEPITAGSQRAGAAQSPHGEAQPYTRKPVPDVKKNIKITQDKDGISIAELLSRKDFYAGKNVKVKGEVTKFNKAIMDKNWIHIQDGTENGGKFDLTITSTAEVKVGEIVSMEGKIVLNKDFGYGYYFEVMMEEGVVK